MTQENFWKLFPNIGKSFRKSLWVMTRFWEKNIFSWVSTHKIYLEIVSGIFPESCPKIAKSGRSFRDIPWVTARFLKIVSGICLYGLIRRYVMISVKSLSLWRSRYDFLPWEVFGLMGLILVLSEVLWLQFESKDIVFVVHPPITALRAFSCSLLIFQTDMVLISMIVWLILVFETKKIQQ